MSQIDDLTLPEQILLLALRDREGTIEFGANYRHALGGAILAELLLTGRLVTMREGERRYAACADESEALAGCAGPAESSVLEDEDVLDECMRLVASSKARTLDDWVTRFANLRSLKHRIASALCGRGILRADAASVLLVFSRTVYPEVDPGPERAIIDRMHAAIFGDHDVEPRIAILIAIARAADLLRYTFERHDLKTRDARLDRIAAGSVCAEATKEAIEAMYAAIMVTTIIPTVVN